MKELSDAYNHTFEVAHQLMKRTDLFESTQRKGHSAIRILRHMSFAKEAPKADKPVKNWRRLVLPTLSLY